MYRYLLLLLSLGFFLSCASSKGLLRKGQYDAAITVAVKKLIKNPNNEKEIYNLSEALRISNDDDNQRIDFLKKSGRPDIWDEVFQRYNALKKRQQSVKRLPVSVLNRISFKEVDYDLEIIESQKRAASYFYARGEELLKKGDKMSARQAFEHFQKVKGYFSAYQDVDKRIEEARYMGTNFIIYQYVNESGMIIPEDFVKELERISLSDLNRQWLEYHTSQIQNLQYDYEINLKLKIIDVSPEQVKEKAYFETKEIQDGWIYALDQKGNVVKDSLGNDVKRPNMKLIKAEIKETTLHKRALVSGILEFKNLRTGQIIKTDPVTSESVFEHQFCTATGDMAAITPETKKKLGNKPMPFPSNAEMILRTNQTLKNMTHDIIKRNQGLIAY
jgi:hypothetical protein